MKLFKWATPLITWKEPWMFAARTRGRRGWRRRAALVLLIYTGMMLGFYADKNWGGLGPKFSTADAVLMSAFIGVFLTSLLDAPGLNRQITITDESINAVGNVGQDISRSIWALRDVLWVRLIRPEELGRSFGAMELLTRRVRARVGVPASMSMARIADVLHSLEIRVTLAGWEPRDPGAGRGSDIGAEAPAPAAMPTASARVERLGEGEAGRILSPFHSDIALAMHLGPLMATVIPGLVLGGYMIYRVKILLAPATVADFTAGFGGMGLFFGGFWFTNRFGNFLPACYLRAVARSVIELRPAALFDPRESEAVCVNVIPRANWGKPMARTATDMGFLKVDPLSRCLLFEGDRERWRIPAASLISAGVESYRPAGHVEGEPGCEVEFVTVIRANVGGQVWENSVSKFHVELRPETNRLREANAFAIRDSIGELRPTAPIFPRSRRSDAVDRIHPGSRMNHVKLKRCPNRISNRGFGRINGNGLASMTIIGDSSRKDLKCTGESLN